MHQRHVVELHWIANPQLAVGLLNLGNSLHIRAMHWDDEADIIEAISLYRKALDLGAADASRRYRVATFSLAEVPRLHYGYTNNLDELREAIDCLRDIMKTDHSKYDSYCHELAIALHIRFLHTGNGADLEDAVPLFQSALEQRPNGHLSRIETLRAAASCFLLRAKIHNSLDDVAQASEWLNEAISAAPLGHPGRALLFSDLAGLHLLSNTRHYNVSLALQLLSDSLRDPHGKLQTTFVNVLKALESVEDILSRQNFDSDTCLDVLNVYRLAIDLLPRVAYLGLDVRRRLQILAKADTLATTAAIHALHLKLSDVAVEVLEEGRALFWTQYLRLRGQFDSLSQELAEKIKTISNQLDVSAAEYIGEPRSTCSDETRAKALVEGEIARRRRLGECLEGLLRQARSLPGFERFLLHDTFTSLSLASSHGPVVMFISSGPSCAALLIRKPDSRAEHFALPSMSCERLKRLGELLKDDNLHNRGAAETSGMKLIVSRPAKSKNVLDELWFQVMEVIVKALGLPVCRRQVQSGNE